MFVDGLWVSGMTLHIHRNGMPIPKGMQDDYIKLVLTPTQANAVAALLGLGYRNGELLLYTDSAMEENIMKKDGWNFRTEYEAINSSARNERRTIQVAKPISESKVMEDIDITKTNGKYYWSAEDVEESEETTTPDDDGWVYVDINDAETYDGPIEYLEDESTSEPGGEESADD